VNNLHLLLALKDRQQLTALGRQLYGQARVVLEHPGATVRLALRDDLAREAAPFADVTEYDLALEIGVPDEERFDFLIEQAAAVTPVIAPYIDPANSVAIAGQQHMLVPGEGTFQLFRSFGRRPELTQEQFNSHFINIHSQFGIDLPGKPGYRQLHRDPAATSQIREVTGLTQVDNIDGVAQLLFASKEIIAGLGENRERGEAAAKDGGLFIDPDTRRTCTAHLVLVAGPIG
jgi:hypothetical protein